MPSENTLLNTGRIPHFASAPFSPDENHLAYATNEEGGGTPSLLLNKQSGNAKTFQQWVTAPDEKKRTIPYPLMSWHPSGEIPAFWLKTKVESGLNFYNLNDQTTQKAAFDRFQKVTHIAYSGNVAANGFFGC